MSLYTMLGSGSQLRQDDPSALKDIIQIVQSKFATQEGESRYGFITSAEKILILIYLSSRTRFMVETLTNLKNNKVKRQSAHGSGEADERIKKFVTGIGKNRHGLCVILS